MKPHLPPVILVLLSATILASKVVQAQTKSTKEAREIIERRDTTASELVRQISAKLPQFKTPFSSREVYYKPQDDLIVVQREKEVLMKPWQAYNDPPGPHTSVLRRPVFTFEVEPFISQEEYVRLKAENNIIHEQLHRMAADMEHISHKFDSYRPTNAEEKKKVDAYNKLKESLHSLPDYYFRDISLSWLYFEDHLISWESLGEDPPFVAITDEKDGWHRQQAETAQSVLKLLSRYEPEAK